MTAEKRTGKRELISDLRAYFQRRGGAKPCNAEKPEPGPQLGWLCTLPVGHKSSRHIAHDIDGTIITAWFDTPPASTEGGA